MGIPLFHSATVKSLLVGICCFKMCSINRLDLIVQCLLCFEKLLQWVVLRKILLSKCHSINKVVLFQVSVWRHLCRTHICLENNCCITWQHSEHITHMVLLVVKMISLWCFPAGVLSRVSYMSLHSGIDWQCDLSGGDAIYLRIISKLLIWSLKSDYILFSNVNK